MLTTYAPWHQVPTLRPDLMSGDGESDSVSEIGDRSRHDESAPLGRRPCDGSGEHTTAIDPTTGHAFVVWAQPDGDFVQAYSTK